MLSYFQTASGEIHWHSLLQFFSWLFVGFFMFSTLRVNRIDRLKTFEKDQVSQKRIAVLEEKLKPIPLNTKIISCLDKINQKIIKSFHDDIKNSRYKLKVTSSVLNELQSLANEDKTSKYIVLTSDPSTIYEESSTAGVLYTVHVELKPDLLKELNNLTSSTV